METVLKKGNKILITISSYNQLLENYSPSSTAFISSPPGKAITSIHIWYQSLITFSCYSSPKLILNKPIVFPKTVYHIDIIVIRYITYLNEKQTFKKKLLLICNHPCFGHNNLNCKWNIELLHISESRLVTCLENYQFLVKNVNYKHLAFFLKKINAPNCNPIFFRNLKPLWNSKTTCIDLEYIDAS